jgi:hypothetical protein
MHASQALDAVLKTSPLMVPWPQLPQRSYRERPEVQSAIGFPGLSVDLKRERVLIDRVVTQRGLDKLALAYLRNELAFGVLPSEYASGLGELLRRVDNGTKIRVLLGHTQGPISLALQIADAQERPLIYDLPLLEALIQHVALRANWQEAQLRAYASDVVICIEEPFLAALDTPFCPLSLADGVELLQRLLGSVQGQRALVVQGLINWELLLDTSIDILIYERGQSEASASLRSAGPALHRLIKRGGAVAWALIPTDSAALSRLDADAVIADFEAFIATIDGIDKQTVLQASLITVGSGLAQLSVEQAERALRLCHATSLRLRELYSFTS